MLVLGGNPSIDEGPQGRGRGLVEWWVTTDGRTEAGVLCVEEKEKGLRGEQSKQRG